MRKIILNLAVTLDGFIARKNGDVDYLDDLDTNGSDLGFNTFLDSCDTIIMGRNSYDITKKLGNNVWPFTKHKTIVFTSKELQNENNIEFTNSDVLSTLTALKESEGKNIWLFGGGQFIKTVRDLNLVDELIITTIPVFIGEGINLYRPSTNEVDLELINTEVVNSIITTHYKVKK